MNPTLFLAVVFLFAPPPKPATQEGRITVWLGDTVTHFKPDGTDPVAVKVPKDLGLPRYGDLAVTPDHQTALFVEDNKSDHAQGISRLRIKAVTIAGPIKTGTFDGYVAVRGYLSADGLKYYICGAKGDELNLKTTKTYQVFVMDLATRKVDTSWSLPEHHVLTAISLSGTVQVTSKTVVENGSVAMQSYVGPTTGKDAAAVFPEKTSVSHALFSPDGTRVLARTRTFEQLAAGNKGGIVTLGKTKPEEFVILDVETRTVRSLVPKPSEQSLLRWAWSPDGKKIAYLEHVVPEGGAGTRMTAVVGGPAPADPIMEYKVTLVDADGSNSNVVYKTKVAGYVRDFRWR